MTAKCVKVVDGDTLVVKCDHNEMIVDLAGVDAPELGQPWGKEVRSFVRDMVRGREIQVEVVKSGDDCTIVRITVGGEDLSQLLAARGLAWATDDGELEGAQRQSPVLALRHLDGPRAGAALGVPRSHRVAAVRSAGGGHAIHSASFVNCADQPWMVPSGNLLGLGRILVRPGD